MELPEARSGLSYYCFCYHLEFFGLLTTLFLDKYTIVATRKRLLLFGCKSTYLFNKVWRKVLKQRIKLSTGVDNFFLRSATATLRMSV